MVEYCLSLQIQQILLTKVQCPQYILKVMKTWIAASLRFLQIIVTGQYTELEYWGLGYKTFPSIIIYIDLSELILKASDHHLCTVNQIINAISVQFSSVAQSCLTPCDPMDCSTPGLPVHHQLLEFTQTHVHWVSDTIQPSHLLLSPSPPTFNLSQHHGLFQGVSSLHQVAKVLVFQLQHHSFQWIFRVDFL